MARARWIGLVLAFVFVCVALGVANAAAPATISGKITSVDIEARTLSVKDPNSGPLVLLVDEHTVIVLDGDEQASLDDLFEGDEVQSAAVRETAAGKLLLVRAVVTSQPPAPGEEDPGDQDGQPPK